MSRKRRAPYTALLWTDEEETELIELSKYMPDKEIGKRLGRTEKAINNHRLIMRRKCTWPEEDF